MIKSLVVSVQSDETKEEHMKQTKTNEERIIPHQKRFELSGCRSLQILLIYLHISTLFALSVSLPHVTWYAPFLTGGGYSSEAITYAIQLRQVLDKSFSIVQFAEHSKSSFLQGLPISTRNVLQSSMIRAYNVAPSIAICHSTPDVWVPNANWGWGSVPCPPPNALFKVGRTMYETDRVPSSWVEKLNLMDRIWVPTEFHRQTFEFSGVSSNKLVVVPEAVDVDFFNPINHQPLPSLMKLLQMKRVNTESESKPYIFLSVFKWENRKNWQGLLKAYFQEFDRNENVVLVMKTSPFHNDRPIENDIDDYAKLIGVGDQHAPYLVYGRQLPLSELPSLYASADAFVLPSRGEGWGRPHAEAMSMGLPVIATNWSGNTAFMNSSNSLPLPVEKLIYRKRGENHMWAEPSVIELQKLMRYCLNQPEEVKHLGKIGRKTMVEEYNPEVVGNIVLKELENIASEMRKKNEL